MTELATYHGAGAVDQAQPTTNSLVSWADGAAAAYRVAEQLVETSFVPQGFRGRPYEATAAILAGQEIGLDPMASLRSFDVIQGTAAPRAMTMRAVVQSKGHRLWLVEANNTRAIYRGVRKGETQVQESVWTIDRAKGLGLTNKENWRKQPMAMLVARATAECARLVAADALLGIPYSSEELDDQGEVEPDPTPAAKPAARRTAKRAPVEPKQPAPTPEPDFDEEPPAPEPADEQPRQSAYSAAGNRPAGDDLPITGPMKAKVGILCEKLGLTDRDEAVRVVSSLIGRPIKSRTELTKAEGHIVIDSLQADLDAREQVEPTFDEQPPDQP